MDPISSAQIFAAVRQVALVLGGYFVARGWIDNDTLTTIVPAILTLAVAAYGIWKRRPAGIIQSASDLPNVHAVITTPQAADAVPRANVVSSVSEASRLPGMS